MFSLRPYQSSAIPVLSRALSVHGAALDGSDTGTGKTPKAMKIAQGRDHVGIICNIAGIPGWKRWCKEAKITPDFILNYEQLKTGKTSWGYWQAFDQFNWVIKERKLLIFDEVHKCCGLKSQNGEILRAAYRQDQDLLLLSATAAESPLDFKHIGYVLGLHNGTNRDFYQFAVNHGANVDRMGHFRFFGNDAGGLIRLHKKLFPEHGHRIRKTDPEVGFPTNTIIAESYDMGDMQEVYDEMQIALDNIDCLVGEAADPLELQLRFRQRAELMRVPFFVEKANELVREGNSVVFFINFSETLRQLGTQLDKKGCSYIHGGITGDERERQRVLFQDNCHKYMVCQYQAGGETLDAHDLKGRPRVGLMSPTYRAKNFKQAIGRINRDGALSPSIHYVCFAADSIEEDVCASLNRKLNNLDTINDADMQEPRTRILK